MTPWYEDDDVVAGIVRDGLLRDDARAPLVPGCDDLREIGRGGQGVVYEAVQTATRRRVAVKVLRDAPGRSRTAHLRFDREMEIVAALRDPRIVQVFAGGILDDGRPYVVMELVVGTRIDAAEHVATARAAGFARPAADPAIALFVALCEGMDHAHRNGIIHRDLKPSNVFVDASGTPRILDFGLAKSFGSVASEGGFATTDAGKFMGSLPWTSPEQADGRAADVDVRSDVYALGATLYHVVTGGPPVPADADLRRMLDAVVNGVPPSLSSLDTRCDRDLEAVILRALEKDPERRYATAGELARDLRRLLAGEPIEARRETALRTLMKLARRRRRVAIASAVIAVVAVAVFLVTSWLWRRAVRESERAVAASARAVAESKRAEAALEFFLDSIGMVDPARDGANTRLTDALDRVSAEIDRRFGEREAAARLKFRMRLRDLYIRLGRFDRGLVEAEAVSALTRASDAQPPSQEFRDRWNGETTRALALYRLGRKEEALALYREAHAALAAVFTEGDRDALMSLAATAQVLRSLNRVGDAEAALRGVVRATEGNATLESGGLARAMALDNLAAIAEMTGRPAEAEAPQREATELYAALKGPNAPEALIARSNLGNLFLTLGRPNEAVVELDATASAFSQKSGAMSPMTLAASHNLGVALLRAGDAARGELVLKDVHDARAKALGPSAHDTLLTLNELAIAAGARGDKVEEERVLRLLVASRKPLPEKPRAAYWNALNNLAGVLRDSGRAAEALILYDELVPGARDDLAEDHWLVAWFSGNRGKCLTNLARFSEAEPLLSSAVSALTARLGASNEHTVTMQKNLDRNARLREGPASR